MGLYARGSYSKKSFSYSYSALHRIRYLALKTCGMPETVCGKKSELLVNNFFLMPNELTGGLVEDMRKFLWAVQQAGYYYPNLMFHSDCEGSYTKTGKVLKCKELLRGNSKKLLKELNLLKDETEEKEKIGYDWDIFISFYDLVSDEVLNGYGHIIFN